jgi:hypothetical protein
VPAVNSSAAAARVPATVSPAACADHPPMRLRRCTGSRVRTPAEKSEPQRSNLLRTIAKETPQTNGQRG